MIATCFISPFAGAVPGFALLAELQGRLQLRRPFCQYSVKLAQFVPRPSALLLKAFCFQRQRFDCFLDLVAPIRFFWSHARPQCLAGARSLCLRWCDIAGCLLYLAAVVLRSYAGWQPGGTCRHACVHTDFPACGAVTAREQDQSHWRDAASSYSMAGPLGYGHLSKPPGFALTWAEKLCARRCRASTSTRTGWTNAPGHIFPWPPCVQLCPAQEKLVKVTPDDALEGTCWQEQPLLCACCDLHGSNYFLGASNICLDPFSFRKLLIRYRMGRCNEKKMGPIFERASHVDSVLLITNEADPPCSKNPEMKCGEHVNPKSSQSFNLEMPSHKRLQLDVGSIQHECRSSSWGFPWFFHIYVSSMM